VRTLLLFIALGVASAAHARSLHGTWAFTEAEAAPWAGGALTNGELKGQRVVFSAVAVRGPIPFQCDQVRYAEVSVPQAGLFMGHLPKPEVAAARRLGFTRPEVASVALSCSSGVYMYHFTPSGALKLAFDQTIWTLKRVD
jgi:hypothetical protein